MIKATLTLPKLETRKVWAGMYGGHLDVIVFFKSKPARTRSIRESLSGKVRVSNADGTGPQTEVLPYELGHAGPDSDANKEKIIGSMWLEDFFFWFPGTREALKPYTQNDRPKAIEIPEVFQIELTAQFDKDDQMYSVEMNADGFR